MRRATGKLSIDGKEIFFRDFIMDWQGSRTIDGVNRDIWMIVQVKEVEGRIVCGTEEYLWTDYKKPYLVDGDMIIDTDRWFYIGDLDGDGKGTVHYIWEGQITREGDTITYPKQTI